MHHRRGGSPPPLSLGLSLALALALALALNVTPAAAVDLHLEQHNRLECSGQFDTALARHASRRTRLTRV
jgi:hypothetical protein